MKFFGLLLSFAAISLFAVFCSNNKETRTDRLVDSEHFRDSILATAIKKFSLPYPENLQLDSNSLIFYCSRPLDTTSLLHLQKRDIIIHGEFYRLLPNYHRYPNDYAEEKSKLLFFEGFSFIIDSLTWKLVKKEAEKVFASAFDTSKRHYTDESTYLLYHNLSSIKGNNLNADIFESYDKFLKRYFLEKFIEAREPIMFKTK